MTEERDQPPVDGIAHQRAGKFVIRWQERLKEVASFQLDGTWSSLGVVDMLFSSLRDADSNDPTAREQLRGGAAYAILVVHSLCQRLGITVGLAQGGRGELELRHGRRNVPFEVELQALIMPGPPVSSPRIDRVVALATPDDDVVTIYCYTCLDECIASMEDTESLWLALRRELAVETSDRAARVMPELRLAHLPELYLDGVCLPDDAEPPNYLLGDAAVDGLARFVSDNRLSESAVKQLTQRLIGWPDMRIAEAAFAVHCAYSPRVPAATVVAFGAARTHRVRELRKQIVRARKLIHNIDDWSERTTVEAELLRMVECEIKLGLIPLLSLEKRRLRSKYAVSYLAPFARALIGGALDQALAVLDDWIAAAPEAVDLQTQRLLLLSVRGGADPEVEEELHALVRKAPDSPRVLDLLGIRALERGEVERAEQYYHDAITRCGRDLEFLPHLANNYGWTLMLLKDYMRAAMIFDIGLREAANPLTLTLNKIFCVRELGSGSEARALEEKILRLAPFERRVMGVHLYEWLRFNGDKVEVAPSRAVIADGSPTSEFARVA